MYMKICISKFLQIIISLIPIIIVLSVGFCHPELRKSNINNFFGEKAYSIEESRLFCQKANGLSSLSFYLPSLYVIIFENIEFKFNQENLEKLFFILINIYNCAGNLIYHMFCFNDGLIFDGSGMNGLIFYILANTSKKIFFSHSYFIWNLIYWVVFVTMFIIFDPFLIKKTEYLDNDKIHSENMYNHLIPIIILVEETYANTIEENYFANYNGLISLILFIIAYIFWNVEQKNYIEVKEDSIFQFHAVWHFLTSIALLFLYRMYKKQNIFEVKREFDLRKVDLSKKDEKKKKKKISEYSYI